MGSSLPAALPAILAAFGAIGLGWQILRSYKSKNIDAKDSSQSEEKTKKRPPSEKPSPEQSKRAKKAGGPVTDISALMAAKTAVPDSDQSDPEKLAQHYSKMASKFEQEGLNLDAVEDGGKYYDVDGMNVEPKAYKDFETPMARGAVRLGVFRILNDESDDLADLLKEAAVDIIKSLPDGSVVHANVKDHFHITVQMISHPSNPRPDSGVPGGGFDADKMSKLIPAPSPAVLSKETATYKEIAQANSAPELKVHSLMFANSGTVLALFTDATGQVYNLRKALALKFPGAVEKQPSIIHATLARLLTVKELSSEERNKVIATCAEWTDKLKSRTFKPEALWHVQENTFTVIDDESSLECPFKGGN